MPYKTINVNPELFIEHNGVKVYHTYKNDCLDEGVRIYWFTTSEGCGESECSCDEQGACLHVFDVRDLESWVAPEEFAQTRDAAVKAIKAAIEAGQIKGEKP